MGLFHISSPNDLEIKLKLSTSFGTRDNSYGLLNGNF